MCIVNDLGCSLVLWWEEMTHVKKTREVQERHSSIHSGDPNRQRRTQGSDIQGSFGNCRVWGPPSPLTQSFLATGAGAGAWPQGYPEGSPSKIYKF